MVKSKLKWKREIINQRRSNAEIFGEKFKYIMSRLEILQNQIYELREIQSNNTKEIATIKSNATLIQGEVDSLNDELVEIYEKMDGG